jgi:tetratricopeptide (TPR) repeat protein
MIALLVAALIAGSWVQKIERLWKKPEPHVADSLEQLRKGDAPKAVESLEKAGEELKEPKQSATLAFDKSAALLMVGPNGAPEAGEQARRALEGQEPSVHAPAAYNLGFALAEQGKREEAVDAYGKALTLDPMDEDARYNLELLLREQKQQQQQNAGQQQDKKDQKDDKKDQQQQSKGDDKDQQKQDDKKDQQQQQQAQKPEKNDKQEQKPKEADKEKKGEEQDKAKIAPEKKEEMAQARPVDRTEAQRLLDALRASEKNLQVWRFGEKPKQPRQRDVAKDW